MLNVELLAQYKSIRKEMLEIDKRIKEMRAKAYSIQSPQISGMPRAPGYSSDGMYRILEQIENQVEVYTQLEIKLNDLCLEIEKTITELPSSERRIIRLRYLEGKRWQDVADIMGYSVNHLHKIHKRIIER